MEDSVSEAKRKMESKVTTKAVIFDCGGVLGKDMRWDLIIDQAHESLKEAVSQTISKEWAKMRIDETYPEKEFWNAIKKVGNLDDKVVAQLEKSLHEEMSPFWGCMGVAEKLIKNGYKAGIVSNHSKFWFENFANRFHIYRLFPDNDLVIPSCNVKCAKPSKDIYKEIFARLQKHIPDIEPKHCIFIDDKMNNTKSAEDFGFRTITWNGAKQDIDELIVAFYSHGVTIFSSQKNN